MDGRVIRMDSDDLDEIETFRETMASSCNNFSTGRGVETMGTQEYNFARRSTPVKTA